MDARLVLGVNADRFTKGTASFTCLHSAYLDAISEVAIPLIIPPLPRKALSLVLDMLDGVVLVGGGDLDPHIDGFLLHPSMRLLDRCREKFDRLLSRMLYERRMPVLGIGGGMQLLNVSQGGNLFFHIPEDRPHALPHLDTSDPNHRHALVVERGTLMERAYGEAEVVVSSRHHMAVDEVAPGFAVTARCPDGVVEAIESTTDWLAVGTQFHPEDSPLGRCIFHAFVVALVARRHTRLDAVA